MIIRDSTGKKLHGGTVKAGDTLNLMGKAPFYIQTIGDDFYVKYQGKTNWISEYPRQGNQFIIGNR
ncbi:MAG: RodZ domain-containing protein [Pseudomonadota bacterium]